MANHLSFFLGGHDLEMVTIRDLLLGSGVDAGDVHDAKLRWGAKASVYRKEIEQVLATGRTPVLIELEDDLGLGDRAIHVDHHGPLGGSDAPTSLHQVFALMQLPAEGWTPWFERVAANDRGWIPELRALGLSDGEIDAVRKADREAQGITVDDETAAERALALGETVCDGKLIIVRLPHNRIAPVMDRLAMTKDPEQNILVISQGDGAEAFEVNFSGEGRIVAMLNERFPRGWSGGALPERGFWGHGTPLPDVVTALLREFGENDPLWLTAGDPETAKDGATFTRFVLPFRYQLGAVTKAEVDGKPQFTRDTAFARDAGRVYERLHYLTVETAGVLFRRAAWFTSRGVPESFSVPSLHDASQTLTVVMNPPRVVLFEYSAAGTTTDPLRAGFLIVDLHLAGNDTCPPSLDDLLRLNELFRFWRRPYFEHAAEAVLRNVPHGGYHERWAAMLNAVIADGEKRFELFPHEWLDDARRSVVDPIALIKDGARSGWIAYADNRTFVWTCAILNGGLDALRGVREADAPAESLGHWVKLLNVDLPGESPAKSRSTRAFERDWARERTQKRWEEFGTIYGFTTHSGAMLAAPNAYLPLVRHWSDMYFDQTLLLLYVRVTTFRFSEQLSAISANARDGGRGAEKRWRAAFDDLRRNFALFTNLYQFPLVSNQQQGIELYDAARKGLDVDDLFREVQQEINSTHEYFELLYNRKQTVTATVMSLVGGGGLALALAMTFLGMNILKFTGITWPPHGTWGTPAELRLFAVVAGAFGLLVFGSAQLLRWIFFRPPRRR